MPACNHTISPDAVACAFSRNRLLRDLDRDCLAILLGNTYRLVCERGDRLNHPAEPIEHLYFVLSGMISRTLVTRCGVERVLELHGPNELCGLVNLYGEETAPIRHVAVEPSILISLPVRDMRRACDMAPQLARRVAAHLARRQQALEEELVNSHVLTANERVYDFFRTHCRPAFAGPGIEPCVHLPASKQIVAARLGMTPESFSRALRELTDSGLIANNGRTIVLRRLVQSLAAQDRPLQPARIAAIQPGRTRTARPGITERRLPAAELINLAGRQRMLSERMAKAWMMIGRRIGPTRARRLLHQSIALYEQQREVLAEVGDRPPITSLMRTEADRWRRYRNLLLDTPRPERMRDLLSANADVLDIAERTTVELLRAQDERVAVIDLAGRQRMLIQRMAKNYYGKAWMAEGVEVESAIERDRDAFAAGLDRLAPLTADSPDLETHLRKVRQHWLGLQRYIGKDAHSVGDDTLAGGMATGSERLVNEMENAVASLVRRAAPPDPGQQRQRVAA